MSLCNLVMRMSRSPCNYFNWLKLSTLCWTQISLALFLDSKQLFGVLAVDVSLLHHYFMTLHLEIWLLILFVMKWYWGVLFLILQSDFILLGRATFPHWLAWPIRVALSWRKNVWGVDSIISENVGSTSGLCTSVNFSCAFVIFDLSRVNLVEG